MAQDATYQTKVYHERNGERYVAGSGGTVAIESVGSLALYSGAQLTMEAGATIELADEGIVATDLRHLLVSEWGDTVILNSLQYASGMAVSNVPANARIVTIVGSTSMAAGSIWMTTVSAGREVLLRLVGDLTGTFTNNATQVSVNASGCTMLTSWGAVTPTFELNTSIDSHTWILFKAIADDVWAVVATGGKVTST